jgi:RNA polymerase-binding transcription factor DksA
MKTNGHAKIGNRIRRDLDGALSRLRQLGGAVMIMDRPGTIGDNSPFADEVDQIQASASRDIGLATRELLQERANRLYSALDRLSEGGYGVCVECAGPIAPARLEAAPEVETCIRCQAGLERLGRRSDSSRGAVFAGGDIKTADEAAFPEDHRET